MADPQNLFFAFVFLVLVLDLICDLILKKTGFEFQNFYIAYNLHSFLILNSPSTYENKCYNEDEFAKHNVQLFFRNNRILFLF